jgi:polyhydroxyalkanoate synthesis regulator protein
MTEIFIQRKNRSLWSVSLKQRVPYSAIKEMIKQGKEIRVFAGKCRGATTKDVTNYILRQVIRYDESLDNSKMLELLKQ